MRGLTADNMQAVDDFIEALEALEAFIDCKIAEDKDIWERKEAVRMAVFKILDIEYP